MLNRNTHIAAIRLNLIKFVIINLIIGHILSLYTGCSFYQKRTPDFVLKRIPLRSYPDLMDDMHYENLADSIQQSLIYLNQVPENQTYRLGNYRVSATAMIHSLDVFKTFIQKGPSPKELNAFIKSNYVMFVSTGSGKTRRVLFTGYYEPLLKGSLEPNDEYRFPIYTLPKDRLTIDLALFSPKFKSERRLVGRLDDNQSVVPYYERSEIDASKFYTKNREVIAWVNDKIDLFFLHIQGSGLVSLDTGEKINVNYHATNGHAYRSVGKLLIDQGKILSEDMSMQKIKTYLTAHPEEVDPVLNYNKSYVFFKQAQDGPFGCYGVAVTPGRSIALERNLFPPCALAFIQSQKPVLDDSGNIVDWINFSRFVLNQDTGGAIKGPGRADLFWGSGAYAEKAAGHMQHEGQLMFLILKEDIN